MDLFHETGLKARRLETLVSTPTFPASSNRAGKLALRLSSAVGHLNTGSFAREGRRLACI